MVIKAKKKVDTNSEEDAATKWPPADYREFVQTQIASKMIVRLGGIGITTIIALSSAYIGLQNYFNASYKAELTAGIKKEVVGDLPVYISKQIVESAKLVQNAEDQLKKGLGKAAQGVIDSPDFQRDLNAKVFKGLEEGGALQKIILAEAWDKAKTGKSDAVRSLGLQLYALFHGGERISSDPQKMRANFVTLAAGDDVTVQLMGAILRHYPMGEHGDAECKKDEVACAESDRLMVVNVLRRLAGANSYFDQFREDYVGLLSRIPRNLQDDVARWIRKEGKTKAQAILTGWARTPSSEFSENAARIMSDFATEDDRQLRLAGLQGLAAMGPDINLHRGTRALVFSQLFAKTKVSKESILANRSGSQGSGSPSLAGSPTLPPIPRPSANSAEDFERELVGRVAVNMLRAGRDDTGKAADVKQDNDWTAVVLSTLKPAPGADLEPAVLRAWLARIGDDARRNLDVSWAADVLLEDSNEAMTKSLAIRRVYAETIQYASPDRFQAFANRYLEQWSSRQPQESDVVIQAILKRDGAPSTKTPYAWLTKALSTPTELLRGALLSEVMFADRSWPKLNGAEWFNELARAGREALASNSGEKVELSRILLAQIEYYLTRVGEPRLRMTESVETSDLLAFNLTNVDQMELLKRVRVHFPWYGERLAALSPALKISKAGEERLPVYSSVAQSPERAVLWWSLTIPAEHNIEIKSPGSASSFVLFDRQRTTPKAYSDPGKNLFLSGLEAGEYALMLRNAADQALDDSVSVVASIGPIVVGPKSRSSPLELSGNRRMEFRSGEGGGQLWLSLVLEAGAEIKLETSEAKIESDPLARRLLQEYGLTSAQLTRILRGPSAESLRQRLPDAQLSEAQIRLLRRSLARLEPDTYIQIFDADLQKELASDDDSGSGMFSRLTFSDTRARRLLVGITESVGDPFGAGVSFQIEVTIKPPPTQ
jgi:hypothetical protein